MPAQGRHDEGRLNADTLMRMQAAHDLAQVRAREGTIEVERVAA